jgi:hypothetical protein
MPHEISLRSKRLDLLVGGFRGYSPVHSVFAGGVSARMTRRAMSGDRRAARSGETTRRAVRSHGMNEEPAEHRNVAAPQ